MALEIFRSLLDRFRCRLRVDFYASTYIDEIWIRSTVREAEGMGLGARLLVSGDRAQWPKDFENIYANSKTPLISAPSVDDLRAQKSEIIVSATSGVPRHYFGKTLKRLIHMPHSLASLHVIYPGNAFDGFDTLFAAGPHHAREFQVLGAANNLGQRKVHAIGYGKMDALRAERQPQNSQSQRHVLIAPSWGDANLIKEMGHALIGKLLAGGFRVTLRPHPSFFIKEEPEMAAIMRDYPGQPGFALERSTGGSAALWSADLMVSDYSGMALEFAALRRKPIVFADLPGKVLNPDWERLGVPPVEVALRERVGKIVPPIVDSVFATVVDLCGAASDSIDFDAAIPLFLYDTPNVGQKAATLIAQIADRKAA